MVLGGILNVWGLIVLISFPRGITLIRSFARHVPENADAETAQLNTMFGLLLMIALILEKMIPL
jgi:1,4-dihydroxy-2-naphthoate octaprenyltransferase